MKVVAKKLFYLFRRKELGRVVGFAFQYFWWMIPVRRIFYEKGVLAFWHPSPVYQEHRLMVPLTSIQTYIELLENYRSIHEDLLRLMMEKSDEDEVCMVNGGPRQDVYQVHFHWVSGADEHFELVQEKKQYEYERRFDLVDIHDRNIWEEVLEYIKMDTLTEPGFTVLYRRSPQGLSVLLQSGKKLI